MKPPNRNLYNADCNTYFYNYPKGSNTWQKVGSRDGKFSTKAIEAFAGMLARNGVDTFLYNPNASRAWWPSKTTPTAWDGYKRGDQSYFYGHVLGQPMTPEQIERYMKNMVDMLDRYLDLAEAGIDLVKETSKACRRQRVAPWLSIRMNDMHGANSLEGSFMNAPLLAHKEYRLQGRSLNDHEKPRQGLKALNYEKREVRDYMFTMIRELVENYDYEGIEIDWTRHMFCCNPVASQKTIDLITGWHQEIAQLCRKKARSTGRPYYFGVRCAANFEHQRHIGLDVVAMAREGFLDFVCPTRAGWTTTWDVDYGRMREQFGEKVALYGVVEGGPNWFPAYEPKYKFRHSLRYLPACPSMIRGNAAGKLAVGADGIETFNFFCADQHIGETNSPRGFTLRADYAALKKIDDLKSMRGKRKFYSFSAGFENWGVRTILEADEYLPQWFEPTTQRRFRIPMSSEPAGMELTIQVIFERPAGGAKLPDFGVSFNDSWPNWRPAQTDRMLDCFGGFTHHVPEYTALNFRFPASMIREGWNDLILAHGAADPGEPAKRHEQGVRVVGIDLLADKAGRSRAKR
jgi:hypothetical protein